MMLTSKLWLIQSGWLALWLILLNIPAVRADFYQNDSVLSSFFEIEVTDSGARVSAKRNLPKSASEKVCRYALTQTLRDSVREELGSLLGTSIPAELGYAESSITNYRSWAEEKWLNCKGEVVEKDRKHNIAALAVNYASDARVEGNEELLRKLIQLGLSDSRTRNDSVVLIAKNSPLESAIEYMQQHLDPLLIRKEALRIAAMELYIRSENYDQALLIGEKCETADCHAIANSAHQKVALQNRESIKDLNSFFE